MKRFSFCPVCGAALTGQHEGPTPVDVIVCGRCGFYFWQNSKPAVAVVLFRTVERDRQVLLTRRGVEPYKGDWDFPGGFLANAELPTDGIVRELQEELGIAVSNPRFFASEIDQYNSEEIAEQARFVLSLFYLCDVAPDVKFTPADDVVEATWFSLERLPLNVAFAANRRALEKLKASFGAT